MTKMKHIIIRNIGPLKTVDIDLKRINVIIGPQSSGKSCILKIACYCCWVEKRIELQQSEERFLTSGEFLKELKRFHKLEGYIHPEAYIEYETDCMKFSYDNATSTFSFQWKEGRWDYKRTKISYIPAERNLVAVIPNWYEVKFADDNIRSFMSDWEEARKAVGDTSVLDLGVTYHYNAATKGDEINLPGGGSLDFTNTSSGLQSLIPLCVFLQYFLEELSKKKVHENVRDLAALYEIVRQYYKEIYSDIDKKSREELFKELSESQVLLTRFSEVGHCDVFLEEPELNLFPSTQHALVNWLAEKTNGERNHTLFLTTHSPYILTSINNLIQAGNVVAEEEGKREVVAEIIPLQHIWNYDDVAAFAIKDGVVVSMKDEEVKLISADAIDDASDIISAEFNRLLEI